MIKVLKQLKEARTLAEFHAADSNGRFAVGICLDYDEEYYMLEGISPVECTRNSPFLVVFALKTGFFL